MKIILLGLIGLLAMLVSMVIIASAYAAQVVFAWDAPSPITGVAGYNLYCGSASGVYGAKNDVPSAATLTKTLTLAPGRNFCVVRAYDALVPVNESGPSNELVVIVPPGAPQNLRATVTLVWDLREQKYAVYLSPFEEVSP